MLTILFSILVNRGVRELDEKEDECHSHEKDE